jgi:ABC-type dipeptide/oligopeptide/nickel transport system permease subunit
MASDPIAVPAGQAQLGSRRGILAALGRARRYPVASLAALALFLVGAAAALAPAASPYDPSAMATGPALSPPGGPHLFGTDRYGRDVLSRVFYGARISMPVGLLAVSFSAVTGSLLGLATGFFGGSVDTVGSGVIDIMLGFPPIMLALLVIAVLGVGVQNVVIAVGVGGIPRFARIVRGTALSIRENVYIEAGYALGASRARLILRHVLPNAMPPIIVLATLYIGSAILDTSSLGFLGLGVQPPTPEWGTMLSEGREFMRYAPWLMFFPGMMVFVTVVAINLVGDHLRAALDPRLQGR